MAEDRTRRVTSSLVKPLIAIMVLACVFVGVFLVVTQYYSDTSLRVSRGSTARASSTPFLLPATS